MSEVNWTTDKIKAALESLKTEDEREAFRRIVNEYAFHAAKRGWHPVRQWDVFADLVREGWRPAEMREQAQAPARERETVERAAVLHKGVIYDVDRPGYHRDAMDKAARLIGEEVYFDQESQGFVTSAGRFVSRYVAARLAFKAGQTATIKNPLTSEDLWRKNP